MITPSTIFPTPLPYNDLRQRVATGCFERMAADIRSHMAQTAPSPGELEDEVLLRAIEVLVDQLRFFGRPDLSSDIETLYYDSLSSLRDGGS